MLLCWKYRASKYEPVGPPASSHYHHNLQWEINSLIVGEIDRHLFFRQDLGALNNFLEGFHWTEPFGGMFRLDGTICSKVSIGRYYLLKCFDWAVPFLSPFLLYHSQVNTMWESVYISPPHLFLGLSLLSETYLFPPPQIIIMCCVHKCWRS